MEEHIFIINGRKATLLKAKKENCPLIILNNFSGDNAPIVKAMHRVRTPDCHLLVIGNLLWDHDMTPWFCPPIVEGDTPCTGGADDYLELLLTDILPKAKDMIMGEPAFTGIAGYSLAGLFALYCLYKCDSFDRAASMSGSLWFPDFKKYVKEHDFQKSPDRLYLSLGEKEALTNNPYLKTVRDNTEEIAEHYQRLGIDVSLEMNPGNHYTDAELRSAKGIKALLE